MFFSIMKAMSCWNNFILIDGVCPMYVTDELRNVILLYHYKYKKKHLSNLAGHASEATRLTVC